MMTDDGYFKKSDVLEAIEKDRQYYAERQQSAVAFWVGKVRDTVEELPTVDVQEVKHGRWVYCGLDDMDDGLFKCTACQGEIFFAEGCDPNEFYGFCPVCGADMRGDKE